MSKKPVVIIGAGIGGLSAALDLCSRGIQVTLLEQHHYTGGKMHETMVGDSRIDTGPTVFTMRSVFDKLFARAGLVLENELKLCEAETLARHFWRNDESLDLFSNVDKTCQAIERFSSTTEANNYRKFARKSEALFQALDESFMQAERPGPIAMGMNAGPSKLVTIMSSPPFVSLWRALCSSFKDPRLQQLFARYSTYCGSSPFKAPATLMLIAHAERAGVWMLPDGMQSLANSLTKAIEKRGGEIRLNTKVQEISCKNNAVRGVLLDTGEYLTTDIVIYNGDSAALSKGLVGSSAKNAVKAVKGASLAALTLATKTTLSGPALSFHNVFFGDDYRAEFDAIFKHGEITTDPTVYVCAQDRIEMAASNSCPAKLDTSTNTDSEKERLFCLMNAPAKRMSEELVKEATHKLINTLESHGLHLAHNESTRQIATPDTFELRCPGSRGALYGQPTHGWSGSFKRSGSRSAITGLYLAGGSVHPGAGVPMVSLSGQIAAQSLCSDWNL